MDNALPGAASFLLLHQDADGAWRDFQLAPGRSDAWVTAWIGTRLRGFPYRDEKIETALNRASRFIEAVRNKDGWGYNTQCPADADTTAHCILFLRAMGRRSPADYAALAKFQLPCGGFSTYKTTDATHGWGTAHPEVTATALRALRGVLSRDHTILLKGLTSLAVHLGGPHGNESYWWPSCRYLALQLRQLAGIWPGPEALSLRAPEDVMSQSEGSFEDALNLRLSILNGDSPARIQRLVKQLETQRSGDGSWPSAPILRIVNPQARGFGDELFINSPVAQDDRRLFTTATVLGALMGALASAGNSA